MLQSTLWKTEINFMKKILSLILAVSVLLGSATQCMNVPGMQMPDITGMISQAVNWISENKGKCLAVGGLLGATVLYKLMNRKTKKYAPKAQPSNKRAQAEQHPQAAQIRQSIATLMEHAMQAGQLFQAKQLPRAYVYGKYCEIAKRGGFDALPQVLRKELANATLAFDLAFAGYDVQTKTQIGLQEALQKSSTRLENALRQAIAITGPQQEEPQAQSTGKAPQGQNQSFLGGIAQAFINQFKANPIATIGLILSSGYSLLAQIKGWWPHAPKAPAAQPNPQPEHAPQPGVQAGVGVN